MSRALAAMILAGLTGCATAPAVKTAPPAPLHDECALLECVTILASHGIMSWGCADCPDTLRMTWRLPETGSPAVLYALRFEMGGRFVEPPVVVFLTAETDSIRGGCAGIDSTGRQGPWSEWSEWGPR